MKKYLIVLLGIVFFASSCIGERGKNLYYAFSPTPSIPLSPAQAETQDALYLSAQMTQLAGEAQFKALQAEGTLVALNLTMAAATSTAIRNNLDATATATTAQEQTRVAAMQQTSVARTAEADALATQTQAAYYQGLFTITPAMATMQALGRKIEADKQTQWFSTWAYRLGLFILFVIVIGTLAGIAWTIWQSRWMIIARLGVVTWGRDGKPYVLVPSKKGVSLLDISRSVEPGIVVDSDTGQVSTAGGYSDSLGQVQAALSANVTERILAQAQGGRMLPVIRGAASPEGGANEAELPAPRIIVLPPDHPRAAPWVEEATRIILADGKMIDGEAEDDV